MGTAAHPGCHGGLFCGHHQDGHCRQYCQPGAAVRPKPLCGHGRDVSAGITGERVCERRGLECRVLPHHVSAGRPTGMQPHAVRHVADAKRHHQLRLAHRQQHAHADLRSWLV